MLHQSPQALLKGYRVLQFLSSALQQTPEGGPAGTPNPANTATLIPASIEGKEEKARFIEMQKEKLKTLMAALEQEAETNRTSGDASHTSVAAVLDNASDANKANVSRSPSSGNMAGDFDHVTMSDAEKEGLTFIGTPRTGGWFSWGGKPVAGPPVARGKNTTSSLSGLRLKCMIICLHLMCCSYRPNDWDYPIHQGRRTYMVRPFLL